MGDRERTLGVKATKMRSNKLSCLLCLLAIVAWMGFAVVAQPTASDKLVGLWKAKKRFGPDVRGTLVIRKDGAAYMANMMGRNIPIGSEAGELIFGLPGDQ